MASTDAYGSMFHTLANRFKQHDNESNARASAQADLSKTRSAPPLATHNYSHPRRPSFVGTETTGLHVCPHCRLVRRSSNSPTSSAAHSPVTRHVNDDCFGNFCPDIAAPARFNPHDPARHHHHHRRSSLLADRDRDRDSSEDSSTSSYGSPATTDTRRSVDPADQRKCQCSHIKPTENLEERYGREPPR